MASRNLARLGVVLGLDIAEWEGSISQAIAKEKELKRTIEADSKAAEKDLLRLKFATDDYGKSLTQVELIQREINGGRYSKAPEFIQQQLLKQAAAYDAVANSAKKAGFAMSDQQKIQLSYQTTDLVTQIASGGNPLVAIMQQGGQLKDVMGGFGNMFRAIGTLLTPLNLALGGLATGIGFVGVAAYKGANEVAALRDALILTNNAAGMTQTSFFELSKTISEKTNLSIGNTKDALMAVAGSGLFAYDAIKPVTEVIANYARVAGVSGKEAADKLISSLDGSASSAARLNSTFHFLTLEQYKHIELLAKQGKLQESIIYTADLLNKSLTGQQRELGLLEKVLEGATHTWSKFWDAALAIGRPETPEDKIAKLRERLGADRSRFTPEGAKKLEAQDSRDAENLRLLQRAEDARKTVILDNAKKIAEEEQRQKLWIAAGGEAKETALRQEFQKLALQNRYEQAKLFVNDIQKIEIDAQEKTALARLETSKKNEAENNVFVKENARNLAEQTIAIERERAKQIREIRLKIYLDESNQKQQQLDEFNAAMSAVEDDYNKEIAAINKVNRENKINAETEQKKINAKIKMFGATQKEIDLINIQIDKQRELDLLVGSGLTAEGLRLKKAGIEEAYKRKEAMAELTEQMRKMGEVENAVFGEMERALEDFVKNGKLSFSDLTKNIIQNLMLIEMKLQATALFKAGLKAAGGFLGEMFNTNIFSNLFGAKAAGGPVQGGASYLVGENGPEIFTSPSSGTIIPNYALAMGGGGQTINYNGPFIQNMSAIDTQSGIAFLSKNKQAVWAANQSAQRSLPVSR